MDGVPQDVVESVLQQLEQMTKETQAEEDGFGAGAEGEMKAHTRAEQVQERRPRRRECAMTSSAQRVSVADCVGVISLNHSSCGGIDELPSRSLESQLQPCIRIELRLQRERLGMQLRSQAQASRMSDRSMRMQICC